jgi:hypothetical protein
MQQGYNSTLQFYESRRCAQRMHTSHGQDVFCFSEVALVQQQEVGQRLGRLGAGAGAVACSPIAEDSGHNGVTSRQ